MKVKGEASPPPEPEAASEKATWAFVAGLALVGFALRAVHLFEVSPHVDEYSTIWAAQQITRRGLPLLPSGFIYLQGVLFSYLEVPFLYLFGFSEPVARFPSLILSAASIPLAYLLGKRIFSPYVGFLTAALLALSPKAIIWGGRARMYATQGFLVLLALYCLDKGAADGDGRRWRYLFAFSFIGALLSQTVTVLLFPALVLGLLAWKGWRWFLRPSVALPLGLAGLGTVGAVGLNAIGGPMSDAARRPFLDPSLYWGYKSSLSFRWFFWSPPRLLLTALFILGFIYLSREFLRAWSEGWAERAVAFEAQNARLTFLYALFSLTMFQMIFLVGETWRRHRYITMLLPIYFLIAAAVATRGLTALARRAPAEARGWIGKGGRALIAVAAVALFLPGAWAAATQSQPGYDRTFRYLRDHWRPGDAVSTPLPAISGVYLGGCDYYALQQGYEAYLTWRDGLWLDRW
ncbi:MAG: glycosyltransferase family 39 protein, partial [Anaerolineae bacterium]